jgi:hypothetical protein
MILRLKSGGRLKALIEPEVGQIVVIAGMLTWKGQKGVVIDKRRHMSFDGMENYLVYNVLVNGAPTWFQSFEIEIFEDSQA